MSLALLLHYLLLNMFRMLIHPSLLSFLCVWYVFDHVSCTYSDVLYMSLHTHMVRCVLVLRCGLAGVVWYPYAG